jgi:pterin-4a-carbinolamine dehydratase
MKTKLTTTVLNLFLTRMMDQSSAAAAQGIATSLAKNADANAAVAKCVPCSALDKSHLIPAEVIRARLAQHELLPGWSFRTVMDSTIAAAQTGQGGGGGEVDGESTMLYRKFTAKHFQAALDAINAMGRIAETENHHPDLHLTNYRDVTVAIYTHKLGGVCENDFILAKLFDEQVPIEYSPKWLKDNPTMMISNSQCTSTTTTATTTTAQD